MKYYILMMKLNRFYRETIAEDDIEYVQYTFQTDLDNKRTRESFIEDIKDVLCEMDKRKLSKKEMRAYKRYSALMAELKTY